MLNNSAEVNCFFAICFTHKLGFQHRNLQFWVKTLVLFKPPRNQNLFLFPVRRTHCSIDLFSWPEVENDLLNI